MVNTTRRSFLTGLAGLFASLAIPSTGEAATTKPEIFTASEKKKLKELYMPICEHLEGNLPFVYNDKGEATIGCGVHFKKFKKELKNEYAIKITPKEGRSLTLNKKRPNGSLISNKKYIEQIVSADWTNSKTRDRFPEVEKVERIKFTDTKENWTIDKECPKSATLEWNKPLFWIPEVSLKKANQYATDSCIQKAWDVHHNDLLKLPVSARLVIVDLIYNLGDTGYGDKGKFPKFKEAIRTRNFEKMKEECKTKNNTRRNTVRQWLIESARLANSGLTEARIKQSLRQGVCLKMSPSCEVGLWCEVDKCTKENCNWKKMELAKQKAKTIARS